MYCKYCGREIADSAVFCTYCGKQTGKSQAKATEKKNETSWQEGSKSNYSSTTEETISLSCPKCGSKNYQLVNWTSVNSTGGGYGCCLGGTGLLCFGPLGLLLGLCGSAPTVYSTNRTYWVCSDCGNKFVTQEDVRKNMKTNEIGITICFILDVCMLILIGKLGWASMLFGLLLSAIMLALWYGSPRAYEQAGYNLEDVLGNSSFWVKNRQRTGAILILNTVLDAILLILLIT